MATIDLPDSIERQLFALDRQVRDATFARGISRLGLIVPIALGLCLAIDWMLALGSGSRLMLLVGWVLLTVAVTWREVLRHVWRPPSFSELAALVERQHPELKERLSSLVELGEHDVHGASPLMRELLARQTARAVERLDLTDAAPAIRSPGTSVLAFLACLLLLVPFALRPADYGLLWARLFAPWGNFHWGATELIVVDGDRVVARGSDVPIQIELRQPRRRPETDETQTVVWLHWIDAVGIKDSRRLEWDSDSRRFATLLPRVAKSLKFRATTTGAQSEEHRIDVADPPTITRLTLDVSPPPYTGLPARSLDGAQGEVHAVERSRIAMKLDFSEPITVGELAWPVPAESTNETMPTDRFTEHKVPIQLSADKRTATVEALAVHSGPFAIRLKNSSGLSNEEPPRSLVVEPDLPPAISLGGSEQPVSVRPDDRYLISVQVKDDFGLTAVELHLESSTGTKRMESIPAADLQERSLTHEFPIDVGDFKLTPGQALTYRVHAVDNRPVPRPQETWTKPRTLMIETRSSAPLDKELAQQEQDTRKQVADLRQEIAETKQELEKLHRQTEDESLKGQNSDKAEQLTKLEQQQAEIAERLQQLAAELSDRPLTEKLGERAQQLADRELAEARGRLEQAKQGESRDQLQPISESIDRLASVDKQLQSLDQQLSELNRLEQDLERLEQLARNTDRLAENLEKLDQQSRPMPDTSPTDSQPAKKPEPGNQAASTANSDPVSQPDQQPDNLAAKPNDPGAVEDERQKLQAEGQKLSDELNDLLRKHPELLDAARRDQLQRLEKLADQAAQLAKPQEQLARAFQDSAVEAPASAERPANNATPTAEPASANDPAKADDPASTPDSAPATPVQNGNPDGSRPQNEPSPESNTRSAEAKAGAQAVKDQQQLAQEATRQALELAQQEGADSKATQAAAEFAKQAAAAAQQAQSGNLDKASQQAEQAANTANEAARELSPAGQPTSKQSEQAADLAQRQQQVAEQMQQLAGSKAAQQGAQQQGQQQLADATESLADRLEQAAKNLGSSPLDSKPGAEAASKAQEAARDAQQAMKHAAQAAQSEDAQGAAEQATRAAEKLQQAAQQAQEGPASPQSGKSIPEELATKVTQAAQQLQKAQQQLSSAKPMTPESQPGQGQPGQGQPGQGQPGQGQPGQGQPGQGQPGQGQPGQGQPEQGQPGQGQPGQGQPGQGQPGQGQPGQGQPGQGQPGQGQPGQGQPSELAQAAEQYRKAAAAMRRVMQGHGQPANGAAATGGTQQAQSMSQNQSDEPGQPGGEGPSGGGGITTEADAKQLDAEFNKLRQRNWGRLPGQLQTEILQGSNKKPRPEYARQIKSYFEEIAKPATREAAP
ncbi:MAG: hypothetical protein JSS49_01320 [Planctomycetes bacterium]|nr:hypothetical protein [Planctomycetota bacterium]